MKYFGAIDVASDNSLVVVIDEKDKIMYERGLPNDLAEIVFAMNRLNMKFNVQRLNQPLTGIGLINPLIDNGYRKRHNFSFKRL